LLKGQKEKIENSNELFSIDARNPTTLIKFKISNNEGRNVENFALKMTKG